VSSPGTDVCKGRPSPGREIFGSSGWHPATTGTLDRGKTGSFSLFVLLSTGRLGGSFVSAWSAAALA
jgi:hypothetical protein